MNEILKSALDTENKAQKIISDALKVKDECDKNIQNAHKLCERSILEAKADCERHRLAKKKEANERISRIETQLEVSLIEMDNRFKSEGEAWCDTLYRRITENI